MLELLKVVFHVLEVLNEIDESVAEIELNYDIEVLWWHVPRRYNTLVDALANNALDYRNEHYRRAIAIWERRRKAVRDG